MLTFSRFSFYAAALPRKHLERLRLIPLFGEEPLGHPRNADNEMQHPNAGVNSIQVNVQMQTGVEMAYFFKCPGEATADKEEKWANKKRH